MTGVDTAPSADSAATILPPWRLQVMIFVAGRSAKRASAWKACPVVHRA